MGALVPEPLGKRYLRVLPKVNRVRSRLDHGSPHVSIKEVGSTGRRIDRSVVEGDAFWSWSVIKTLRHTGVRGEELTELTLLALISSELPDQPPEKGEAVTGGLPVHIAARILGHRTLTAAQAYLAVLQGDVTRTYRGFLDRRRAARPQKEYREPTPQEARLPAALRTPQGLARHPRAPLRNPLHIRARLLLRTSLGSNSVQAT
ncbi:hypothetical protein [Streptomyces sp. M54]|uniref:hypothetical protein n=1 Tax=Streptomyces sp. M54 TaxID=2759525 RepID=UPI001A8C1347|nr:hypothetical protein [Streptomyces sp. M54]